MNSTYFIVGVFNGCSAEVKITSDYQGEILDQTFVQISPADEASARALGIVAPDNSMKIRPKEWIW